MQLQNRFEKPVIFVSHILSDQATRWRIMELEVNAFVYCVKQLSLSIGQIIYSTRTWSIYLILRFQNWCVGESFSQISCHRAYFWRAKYRCRWTHKGEYIGIQEIGQMQTTYVSR